MNETKSRQEIPYKIDFKRQLAIFDPSNFSSSNNRIDVIGVGATGSYVVLQLAKLGITNIHVWDADCVEAHNLPNQLYGIEDIGKPKVEALKEIIYRLTGINIICHKKFVTKDTKDLGQVIFLLTDSMSSRQEIYNGCLKYNPNTQICIETRLAATTGRIYTFNPTDILDQENWEKTLYTDVVAEKSECGTTIVMGASSSYVASMAVWQMIKWWSFTNGAADVAPEFELLLFIAPKFKIVNLNETIEETN